MPTVAVNKDVLFELMGKPYTQEQFNDLCFSFGIELDDVTSERLMYQREHEVQGMTNDQKAALTAKLATLSDEQVYKIDTPANRYDLLSAESLTTALKVFSGFMMAPKLKVLPPTLKMVVKKSVSSIRPYCVCAVLRGITMTPERYRSFNEFQDKLHSGLARKRTLASVGAHDLDHVEGPFSYEALPKKDINFIPLEQTKMLHCGEGGGLVEYYQQNPYISKFIPILAPFENYPVVFDQQRRIMSLPPIINSDFSKISVATKNIFIECTATDHHRASTLVTQLVSAFSMYCSEPFTVEAVEVKYEQENALDGVLSANTEENVRATGHSSAAVAAAMAASGATGIVTEGGAPTSTEKGIEFTPALHSRTFEVDVASLRSIIGIDVNTKDCCGLLKKMMLEATDLSVKEPVAKKDKLSVLVPPYRGDVLHERDIHEDVAIAFGIDNIKMVPPTTLSHGSQQPINKLSHLLRLEVSAAGFVEMLTFSLCSKEDAFKSCNRKEPPTWALLAAAAKEGSAAGSVPLVAGEPVCIANPQTIEFQICRPSLLPGTMKTVAANKHQPLPLKFFEVSDVMLCDPSDRTGVKNERHFAAIAIQAGTVSFEDIHGLAEMVLHKLDVPKVMSSGAPAAASGAAAPAAGHGGLTKFYELEGNDDDGAFFPGRALRIMLTNNGTKKEIGRFGVLHPRCLGSLSITTPCSYVELNLDALL